MDNASIISYVFIPNDLLTSEQQAIIMECGSIAWTLVSFLGIISNIINIRTFIAMGLNDGVTVSFLFLSLFDLSFLIMSCCFGVTTGLSIIEVRTSLRFQVEPYGLFMFFGHVSVLLNVTNTLSTTFLAVARCMCVAKPLSFRNTFTQTRTIVFNIEFVTFAVAIYTPILANMGMFPKTDKSTNVTRPALWTSKDRESIKDGVWVLVNTVLPFLSEVVIMVCVFVMASSLHAASRFRQASTLSSPTGLQQQFDKDRTENIKNAVNTISDKMSGKDQRVVQQVILISAVYIICNTPKIIFSIVGVIEPNFSLIGRYRRLYVSIHCLEKHLEIGNASVNTFIYYNFNTKFRKNLRRLVGSQN